MPSLHTTERKLTWFRLSIKIKHFSQINSNRIATRTTGSRVEAVESK